MPCLFFIFAHGGKTSDEQRVGSPSMFASASRQCDRQRTPCETLVELHHVENMVREFSTNSVSHPLAKNRRARAGQPVKTPKEKNDSRMKMMLSKKIALVGNLGADIFIKKLIKVLRKFHVALKMCLMGV